MCLSWERRQKESLRAREKSSVGKAKDGKDGGKMSCVFMFTACPFDVHTKTTWGPQQPIPVANMTVGLAATLHAWDSTLPLFPPCPAVLTTIPSLSSTLMASHTSYYPTLHLTCQSTFGTPGLSLPFLPTSLPMMPMILETTPYCETGTPYATEKYCPLTLNFLNKNDGRGQSSLCERSPLDWSKSEKLEKYEQCRVQTHIHQHCISTVAHEHTFGHTEHYSFSLQNS